MTIGDVMAFTGAVLATGATLWAAQVSCAVLYEKQTRRAAAYLEREWISTLLTGAGVTITAGLLALVLLQQGNGLIKLIGWVLLSALLAHSILGAAGLALLASERIKKLAPRLSKLAHIQRAAGLLIAAGFLPVFGWLFIFPMAFCFSLGAGWRAMTGKARNEIANEPPVTSESVTNGFAVAAANPAAGFTKPSEDVAVAAVPVGSATDIKVEG